MALPVTDDQAKAIQEVAKLGVESLTTVKEAAGSFARIFGTVPEDMVGLLGGDWIRLKRLENFISIEAKAQEILHRRGVPAPSPVSLSLSIPLLKSASDEDRAPLADLWARLLAASMEQSRSGTVRRIFIDVVSKMDPLDARVITLVSRPSSTIPKRDSIAKELGVQSNEVVVSFLNLMDLKLIWETGQAPGQPLNVVNNPYLLPLGTELLRAVED